ncbi:membrane-bound lytic murein transglycosylase MltF [Aliagarivorans marinus]|uniref:membrane-bound lytic murein transglycosylase MltF n=1 Tax=Aliagarivorans marinus TaxID=561965 RepID=UPI00041DBEB9|nr:membrane-bound lytic murein transglycosylase MltF [Aliagarivorans marinus]
MITDFRRWWYLGAALLSLTLLGCEPLSFTQEIKKIQDRGELRVGTLYHPQVFYYNQDDKEAGFEYELAAEFAEQLGVKLTMVPLFTKAELYRSLENKQVDMIAAALSPTDKLAEQFRFSPELYQVDAVVVYKKNTFRPREINQVDAPLWLTAGSHHYGLLRGIAEDDDELELDLTVTDQQDASELLKAITDDEIRFAVVDDTTLALHQRFYPDLNQAFTVKSGIPVVWMINQSRDDSLFSAMIEFVGQQHVDGEVARLLEKYFSHVEEFDYVDTRTFLRSAKSKLPEYQPLFEKYAGSLDWRLLAAVSYQESHWEPHARSFTGVRGMMMLTLDTAKGVGVKNRLDAEQSIRGGSTYLQQLIARVPDSIPEDEKIWFALSAYNMGFGHMLDVRRLTRMRGGNPDSWLDVKDNLPLLMRKEWYKQTRYGYARGAEAYHYVNNIRQYYQSLLWLESEQREAARREAIRRSIMPITPEAFSNPADLSEQDLEIEEVSSTNTTDT